MSIPREPVTTRVPQMGPPALVAIAATSPPAAASAPLANYHDDALLPPADQAVPILSPWRPNLLPPLSLRQLPLLWLLPVLWVALMFASFFGFQDAGRSAVMETRLLLGGLLIAGLWVWLQRSGQPAVRLLGWHVAPRDRVLAAVILGLGLWALWPHLQADSLASRLQPALIEETLFRGFVFGVVAAVAGPWRALWWSAWLFGGIHLYEGLGTAVGSALSALFLLGTARLATGNVVAPVVMHALMNAGRMEMALLVWGVAVVGSGLTQARDADHRPPAVRDDFLSLGQRLQGRLRHSWLAWPLAFEWRLWSFRRPAAHGGEPVSDPDRSPLPGLLGALMALLVLEGLAVHFMVRELGDGRAALAIGAVEVLALLWVYALRRQVGVRPSLLYPDRLLIRSGLLWTAEVPRRCVAAAEVLPSGARGMTGRHLSPLERPNVRLRLTEPVVCRSLWGWPVTAREVTFRVQEPERIQWWAQDGADVHRAAATP